MKHHCRRKHCEFESDVPGGPLRCQKCGSIQWKDIFRNVPIDAIHDIINCAECSALYPELTGEKKHAPAKPAKAK